MKAATTKTHTTVVKTDPSNGNDETSVLRRLVDAILAYQTVFPVYVSSRASEDAAQELRNAMGDAQVSLGDFPAPAPATRVVEEKEDAAA